MGRNIDDILCFRQDISPFLVHLTRAKDSNTAEQVLRKILRESKLIAGSDPISDARFFVRNAAEKSRFCRAISLTETPLNEIHCLIDIFGRSIELEPYGIVFLKDKLQKKGVSPVIYLNNEKDDKRPIIEALCKLVEINPEAAEQLLPLISSFGEMLLKEGKFDFTWEREWRYPSIFGDLEFAIEDIFVGICPDALIDRLEADFPGIKFVDCYRNTKWYATKLVQARRDRELKCSVV